MLAQCHSTICAAGPTLSQYNYGKRLIFADLNLSVRRPTLDVRILLLKRQILTSTVDPRTEKIKNV